MLAAAAVLHVALALGLHWAGRAQVAPGLIDRDGIMDTFAHDSYEYQSGAARLAEILKSEGLAAWAAEAQPLHVRLISVQFALLGPLVGRGPLCAEPFNLACYLSVIWLTLLLGRELGGARAGTLAAATVAVWPTFLLHTLQLLKDPLFIALALVLMLCVTTWLTRVYGPVQAAGASVLVGASAALLVLIRFNFAIVVVALVLLGLALLIVRQMSEGRWLPWNMAAPVLILVAGALLTLPLLFSGGPASAQVVKRFPAEGDGRPKASAEEGERVTALVEYLPHAAERDGWGPGRAGRLLASADRTARRLGSFRTRFSASYTDAGSGVDQRVRVEGLASLVGYLPRAFAVGMWAPFPNSWAGAGKRVGSAGKLLSGAETLAVYVFQLLAVAALFLPPRRLAAWLLLALTTFGVTALGLVVPNLGALYRFRYTFWILLIVLGAKGLVAVLALTARGRRAALAGAALACLAAVIFTTVAQPSEAKGAGAAVVPAAGRAGELGFTLSNSTGTALRRVYLSPGASAGWEENVAGPGGLADGESLRVQFSPEERADVWDVRVEGVDGRFAEWQGLRLGGATRVRMYLDLRGERVVVAEVE